MPTSNFPNGFKNGITIRGIPLVVSNPGKVYWVGNSTVLADGAKSASNNNDGSFLAPWSTLAYAMTRVTAGRGDVIMIKPGHTETISNATTLLFNKAGAAVVGLGQGTARPTITMSTAATANIPVTANNVSISNVIFVANFADIASVFTLTAAADFVVDGCEFRDTSSILNFLTIVTTVVSTNNNGLTFVNNKVYGLGTTAATTPIKVASTMDRIYINDNTVNLAVLNNTSALLAHAALVVTNLEMARNKVFRLNTDTSSGALLITTSSTTNTGNVFDNYVKCADAAAILLVTAGSIYGCFQNFVSGAANTSGFLLPAADTDS